MQHAFYGRTDRLLSILRALILGCGIILAPSVAFSQYSATNPSGAGAADPQDGKGVGLHLPKQHRSKPAKLALDEDDKKVDTAFTLDDPMLAVRIEGNTTITNSEIAKHIKTRPGRPITQKQIKDDVDALVRTRWFATVEPSIRRTDDGNVLVFRVLERPIVRKVEYRGNKKIKTKKFEEMTQLKEGQPYDVSVNRECARRIQEYYVQKGFPFATVELERGDVRSDPDREVIFIINEGPKVKVTRVEFEGNKEFSDQLLKMKTRSKVQIVFWGGKYDPSSINDDIEGVREYYHSLGYFDVKITPDQRFSDDKAKVVLHYDVDEGVRYRIDNVSFVGNNVLSDENIRELIKVKPGDMYNARDITKDVETLKVKYGEQGRLFSAVADVRRWSEEPGVLDLVYKINEDKVYRIRNMNIHIGGDYPHTRNNLIRNISPLKPGDLADPKKITQMKQRLAGSQYFETDQSNPMAAGGIRVDTSVVKDPNWLKGPSIWVARGQESSDDFNPGPSQEEPLPSARFRPVVNQDPPARTTNQQSAPFGTRPSNGIGHSYAPFRDAIPTPVVRPTSASKPIVPETNSTRSERDEPTERPYFQGITPPPSQVEAAAAAVDDDPFVPVTAAVIRAQSKDPIQPPANPIFDAGPQGDPYGKPIRNPDPYDEWNRLPPPEFIDLDTYLSEGRTGRLMFGVGVNSNTGLVGNIVLSEQNFSYRDVPKSWSDIWNGTAWRGNGEKLRIEAMPGLYMSRYGADWTNPYFMDTPTSLSLSGFYFQRYWLNWTEQRTGGRVRLGRALNQYWSVSGGPRLEDVDVYNPSTPIPPPILRNSLGSHLLSTVQGQVAYDRRDNSFMPSSGYRIDLNVEQAFGQYNYPRVDLDARKYFTLYQRIDGGGKHTLSLHGEVAWTGSDTPIYERFFAGGFQSMRGFYIRGVSPFQQGVYIGGDFMAVGSVEYMFPILANEMVKFVTFTDFGTVNNDVSLDNFRVAVGAGLRITIPMLGPTPLAIDFATPLHRAPTDRLQVISFMMGYAR